VEDQPKPNGALDASGPEHEGDVPLEAELMPEAVEETSAVAPEIAREWERLQHPKTSWAKTVAILAVSAVLFVWLGLLASPAVDIVMLIGVLLVHELGHFCGMRLFGYRDVRMFFIPFFGAAVSGRTAGVESYKQAIVVLLGPLPGLCLSLPLLVAYASTRIEVFYRLSLLLLILNGFNLLPVLPLDGGRLVQILLFSRNRYLEWVAGVLTALTLLLLGWRLDFWIFYVLGGFLLLGAGHSFKVASLARSLNTELGRAAPSAGDEIPPPALKMIADRVKANFPSIGRARTIAGIMMQVWERMHARAPGLVATLALLAVYLFSLAAVVAIPVVVWAVSGLGN
jgi:Zn-dependent protease